MFSTPNKTTQDVKDEQTHFKRLICHRAFDDDLLLSRNALFASELIGQIIFVRSPRHSARQRVPSDASFRKPSRPRYVRQRTDCTCLRHYAVFKASQVTRFQVAVRRS